MPQHSLADAKVRLNEVMAILESRIAEQAKSDPHGPLHDRLVVARECIRDALDKVQHAEEAMSSEP